MDACGFHSDCEGCPGRVVCHYLQITEEVVLEAIYTLELRTVTEIRMATGAGDGCTACHRRLRQVLESQRERALAQPSASSAPSPI